MKFGVSQALLALSVIATGCVTTKVAKDKPLTSEETVVRQAGNPTPVFSRMGHSFWMDVRQNSKQDGTRLRATLATGEWSVAVSEAEKHLSEKPGSKSGLLVLASALAMGKKYSRARYYAELYERKHGASAESRNVIGLATLMAPQPNARQWNQAKEIFYQAFQSDSKEIAAGLNLGHLQLATGQSANAFETLSEVSRRCNQCSAATLSKGIAASRSGRHGAAKAAFEKIINQDEDHLEARYHLAMLYKNGLNDLPKAKETLKQLLDRSGGKQAVRNKAQIALRRMHSVGEPGERDGEDLEALEATLQD